MKPILFILMLLNILNANNDTETDFALLYENRFELGLLDNIIGDENALFKSRINYFHTLIIFDNGTFHGISSDLMYTWLIFGLMFTGAIDENSTKYIALINGGYVLQFKKQLALEITNSFHPMLFVENNGIIINSKINMVVGTKIRGKIGFYQNIDFTKNDDYRIGINLGIGI